MNNPKMLTGAELVARGVTKIDASLPEVGMKDVVPSGSWLEQKQIQAALEARKHLVEVERIEKRGIISHALWCDDIKLAEVTQQAGGYWQYLGHNIGKKLYLRPEEALFLMESNCLVLKYNEVVVSIQKAYSLLLIEPIVLKQYKVYASLSRIGYKVYRHRNIEGNKKLKSQDKQDISTDKSKRINDPEQETDTGTCEDNLEKVDSLNKGHSGFIDISHQTHNSEELNTENSNKHIEIIELGDNMVISRDTVDYDPKQQIIISNPEEFLNNIGSNKITNNMQEIENEDNEKINKDINANNQNVPNNSKVIESIEIESSSSTNSKVIEPIEIENFSSTNSKVIESIEIENSSSTNSKVIESIDIKSSSSTNSKVIEPIEIENFSSTNSKMIESIEIENSSSTNSKVIESIEIKSSSNTNSKVIDPIEIENFSSTNSKVIESIEIKSSSSTNSKVIEPIEIENSSSNQEKSAANVQESFSISKIKLQALQQRQFKPCSSEDIHKHFGAIPDLLKKTVVTIHVPDEKYIPRNVFVNHTKYDLNLNLLRLKPTRCSSNETVYSNTDEVNAPHIRRLHGSLQSDIPQNNANFIQNDIRQPNFMQFRPSNFWRPQVTRRTNVPFNMMFQRSIPNQLFVPPQFNFMQNPSFFRPFHNFNFGNMIQNQQTMFRPYYNQSDTVDRKLLHLQCIRSLAIRAKKLDWPMQMRREHLKSLTRLIDLYNATYNYHIRLSNNFDLIEDPNIVDTIELNDDEEPKRKKSRLSTKKFDENLNGLKDLALRLKIYETHNGPKQKYRRALCNVIKKFNKTYNAEVHLNKEYEIIDKRHVTLDSSSDSDCVVTEPNDSCKRKKVRNPFNILKKTAIEGNLNKENVPNDASKAGTSGNCSSDGIKKIFDKNWSPGEDDFGRAEVVPKYLMNPRLISSIRDRYIYELLKDDSKTFNSWLDMKLIYLKYVENRDQVINYQQKLVNECNISSTAETGVRPLLRPEDCTDMRKVLDRLSIIPTNKDTAGETKYKIDFDVYTRDVKNFRKSNPPPPHFRIVCIDESGSFPAALDIATLNMKYQDNIPILFAVVGTASISYVQVNSIDLPIYIPKSDLT